MIMARRTAKVRYFTIDTDEFARTMQGALQAGAIVALQGLGSKVAKKPKPSDAAPLVGVLAHPCNLNRRPKEKA